MKREILIALNHKGEIAGGGCTARYLNAYLELMECDGNVPSWVGRYCVCASCDFVYIGKPCTKHNATLDIKEEKT